MRRFFILTILTLMILAVGLTALEAQTVPDNPVTNPTENPENPVSKPNQWQMLVVIIATLFPLGVKIMKWFGIDIEKHALYPILVKLIEIIAGVEERKNGTVGSKKKETVVQLAAKRLKPREIKMLNRRFGSLDAAVQAAYEVSSVSKKKTAGGQ